MTELQLYCSCEFPLNFEIASIKRENESRGVVMCAGHVWRYGVVCAAVPRCMWCLIVHGDFMGICL